MFDFLTGKVAKIGDDFVSLDVGGVGFKIFTSQSSIASIDIGDNITFWTYLSITENDMRLFGFVTESERIMFESLITVSGVGPKIAAAILSQMNVQDLATAIIKGDFKTITKAKGVGAKMAQNIVVNLKDKISNAFEATDDLPDTEINAKPDTAANTEMTEAEEALTVLGIPAQKAKQMVESVYKEGLTTQEIIKRALAAR